MTKFKDCCHLYLGCKVQVLEGGICRLESVQYNSDLVRISDAECRDAGMFIFIDEIKPILRPLSSMTEEEATEGLGYDSSIYIPFKSWNISGKNVFSPKEFAFLLSKGFDLFGLIPSGEAIDATKTTTTA